MTIRMKLWLLRSRDGFGEDNPWEPWYDKPIGYVIRAETEEKARGMAEARSGTALEKGTWLNLKYSTCVELLAEGLSEVVIEDHAAGA